MEHMPVMLEEVISALNLKENGTYVDCTFGAGGYTKAILAHKNTRVIALDQDPSTKEYARIIEDDFGARFTYINDNFRNLAQAISAYIPVDGIVYDLGVSSMQLDRQERGFSFQTNARLDMRMSQNGRSAYDIVNESDEAALADIIYFFGDETHARKIAARIVEKRQIKPIETSFELAAIVRSVVAKKGKIDPATKTFQAIRIAVNDELNALEASLAQINTSLKIGGRAVIVSFHSLEDSIVKKFCVTNSEIKIAKSKYAKDTIRQGMPFRMVSRKALKPSRNEVLANPRARSSKMRIIEKVG